MTNPDPTTRSPQPQDHHRLSLQEILSDLQLLESHLGSDRKGRDLHPFLSDLSSSSSRDPLQPRPSLASRIDDGQALLLLLGSHSASTMTNEGLPPSPPPTDPIYQSLSLRFIDSCQRIINLNEEEVVDVSLSDHRRNPPSFSSSSSSLLGPYKPPASEPHSGTPPYPSSSSTRSPPSASKGFVKGTRLDLLHSKLASLQTEAEALERGLAHSLRILDQAGGSVSVLEEGGQGKEEEEEEERKGSHLEAQEQYGDTKDDLEDTDEYQEYARVGKAREGELVEQDKDPIDQEGGTTSGRVSEPLAHDGDGDQGTVADRQGIAAVDEEEDDPWDLS
ncbi:hypothetical protein IE53DRAFT_377815 [Violaceomyces palustris]|uniref:Uncharacterized protein n=1 Tax=Violaceomyces palustris TaxID=1673888 RepID=A0ACD0P464_9BASI|nr:hypothetical protein IE53DRAFT_377815 [Violaceomyces palustris]